MFEANGNPSCIPVKKNTNTIGVVTRLSPLTTAPNSIWSSGSPNA